MLLDERRHGEMTAGTGDLLLLSATTASFTYNLHLLVGI
jgi:hypothetical protein